MVLDFLFNNFDIITTNLLKTKNKIIDQIQTIKKSQKY